MKNRVNKLLSLLIALIISFSLFACQGDNPSESEEKIWLSASEINIPIEYDFSFMAIGDPQIITENEPEKLKNIYDYVIDNVQTKKVQHVFGLGDITDNDTFSEWNIAKEQIARMDSVVPYSIIRGNHDILSSKNLNNGVLSMKVSTNFDEIYGTPNSPYANQYTYCFEGEGEEFRARNTIHFFSSTTRDYMVVALDYGASDNVLNWANEIIKAHPYHNVIVTTHNYLDIDGTTSDKGEGSVPSRDYNLDNSYGVNDGNDMWNKLISKHKNIILVLCGHHPLDQLLMVKSTGDKGNEIAQILIDPQGMDKGDAKGMVATFYVDKNGEDITVEWYSTIKNQYYKKSNNYSFKVNVIEREN